MTWPSYVLKRDVYIPEADVLEEEIPLHVRVTIKASRSLVYIETGYRLQSYFVKNISSLNQRVNFELPATDMSGWKDPETNEEIVIEDPSQYTHTYTACIQFVTENGRLVGEAYELGPFIAPAWPELAPPNPINLATALEAGSSEGEQVLIPPNWVGLIETALPNRIKQTTDYTVITDLDHPIYSGWYRTDVDPLNAPRSGTSWYVSFIAGELAQDGIETAHGHDGSYKNMAFVRSKIDGVWSSWSSLGSSGGTYPLMEDPDDEGTYLITSPNDVVEDENDPGTFLVVN